MKNIRLVWALSMFLSLFFGLSEINNPAYSGTKDGNNESNIYFNWAFCSFTNAQDGPKIEIINRDKKMKTGDKIKFYIKHNNNCFVYLINKNSQEELSVLYPKQIIEKGREYDFSENQYIPEGDMWFDLDEKTGMEKFYLLASKKRLLQLEKYLIKYNVIGPKQKIELKDKIIAEIKQLRKNNKTLQSTAERPVSIGGTVRGTGLDYDVASSAIEISVSEFYSRTFTIDHR